MQENKILVQIPFSGFYCSVWDSLIDGAIESEIEWYNKENRTEKTSDDFEFDYRAIFEKIAKKYCFYWGNQLNDSILFNTGESFDISFKFESLQSPKYYNFETDRIFAYCDFEKFKELYNYLAKYGFKEWLWERMKPRSGFIPHYSNCLEDWGDIETWDYNQYGLFLEWLNGQYIEEWDLEDSLLETVNYGIIENMELIEND